MNSKRLEQITARYAGLSIALVGDFCLDRYLEIDPARQETSLETGLPVHNVTRVRSQPGAAGTVLNNLVALGVGRIIPLGFAGDDGEGFELIRALRAMPGVSMDAFVQTPLRRTFTYCKPLVLEAGKPPRELNRLDSKNWTPTPAALEDRLSAALQECARRIDALIVMDQVDLADTGVATRRVLEALGAIAAAAARVVRAGRQPPQSPRLSGRRPEDEPRRVGHALGQQVAGRARSDQAVRRRVGPAQRPRTSSSPWRKTASWGPLPAASWPTPGRCRSAARSTSSGRAIRSPPTWPPPWPPGPVSPKRSSWPMRPPRW